MEGEGGEGRWRGEGKGEEGRVGRVERGGWRGEVERGRER